VSAPNNVVELVKAAVLEQIRGQADDAARTAVEQAVADARAHLDALIADAPRIIADGPAIEPEDARGDAKQRAGRTAIQGAVATVFLAVALTVSGAISGSGFDFTSGGDWKAVAGAAVGAAVAAGTAYVQRIVSPPRARE